MTPTRLQVRGALLALMNAVAFAAPSTHFPSAAWAKNHGATPKRSGCCSH